jgi:cell division protein WhiA
MTFSSIVKDEVCRYPLTKPCCLNAELLGMILMIKKINPVQFKFSTEISSLARRLVKILKKIGYQDVRVEFKKNQVRRNGFIYIVKCESFSRKTFIQKNTKNNTFSPLDNITRTCCKRSLARGCFLAGGWLTNPEKLYSIQLIFSNVAYMNFCFHVLTSLGFPMKNVIKNNDTILYLRDSEAIADFLTIIGATSSLMKFENIRILKEVKNNVNRAVNCETANLEKIVISSLKQIDDITLIQRTIGLRNLPEKLQDMAEVRLQNREASLQELGEFLSPPIGKSGVNHRLKKLEKLAAEIRTRKGEENG